MRFLQDISSHKEDTFTVHEGISAELREQLVAYSASDDPDLRKFTSDARRFATAEDLKEWTKDTTRAIYTLTPEQHHESLAGFGWLRADSDMHLPDTVVNKDLLELYQSTSSEMRHTVAARIYGQYRGLKLAKPFMEVAHLEYMKKIQSDVALILADIHAKNIPSQTLFQRLGYALLGSKGDRTLWILDATK